MAPGIGNGDLVLIDTAKTLADVPTRAAKDRRPHVPCRIYHPAPVGEVLSSSGWGALVERSDQFKILFSDGVVISPEWA